MSGRLATAMFCSALLLGCAHRAEQPVAPPPQVLYLEREVPRAAEPADDELLFLEFLEELPTGATAARELLVARHPSSVWTSRALLVVELLRQRNDRAALAKREASERQEALLQCESERSEIGADYQRLVEEREQLKKMLVQDARQAK